MSAKGSNASLNSNSLLAYKLLSDAWDKEPGDNVFAQLMREELKTLATSISLLQADPVLAMHYGGVNLNAAEKVSDVLKSKVGELDVRGRIEPTAKALLYNKYSAESQQFLMPGKIDAVELGDEGTLTIGVKSGAKVGYTGNPVKNPFNIVTGKGSAQLGVKADIAKTGQDK